MTQIPQYERPSHFLRAQNNDRWRSPENSQFVQSYDLELPEPGILLIPIEFLSVFGLDDPVRCSMRFWVATF